MPDPLNVLRVNALELLRQPGGTRRVTETIEPEPLEIEHPALDGRIEVDVELESTTDGIVVRGEVTAPWHGACRRCLAELSGRAVAEVDERYLRPDAAELGIVDDDAFQIERELLDLAPMVRQVVLLELDDERLCRAECAGLCPVCGIDRNAGSCDCDTTVRDDRWAALDDLVLDD